MRRLFDVTVAVLALIALGPVLLGIVVVIRMTMGGPVLFRQTRSGLHGRPFQILKFRTMRDPRFPDEPDAGRITGTGRVLRTTSLDELPQLINVLRGDMGIIGPRPTLPEQVRHYTPRQRGRLDVRPGLTGWAQVQGRNALSWPVRIEYDLWYVAHRGARVDCLILLRTVGVLLRPTGITAAGGVNPGFPAPVKAAEPHPLADISWTTPAPHPRVDPPPPADPLPPTPPIRPGETVAEEVS